MARIIQTDKAPAPVGPYSQAVEVDGVLFCSGQIPIVPETGTLLTGDIQEQTRQVMVNIEAVLFAAGYGWNLSAMSGLGYRQFQPYFEGESTLEEAVERIKFETHRFVRMQNNWFGRDDETRQMLDASASDLVEGATQLVADWHR